MNVGGNEGPSSGETLSHCGMVESSQSGEAGPRLLQKHRLHR